MRYTVTPTLIRLNDRAVVNDFNEWIKAEFFDLVAPDGLHVLSHALPHGIRPWPESDSWPQHYRTGWYAQMADGSNQFVKLDIEKSEYEQLLPIEDTPDELVGRRDGGRFESFPAIVVLGDDQLLDGKHVIVAVQELAEQGDPRVEDPKEPVLVLPALSDDEVEDIRRRIPQS